MRTPLWPQINIRVKLFRYGSYRSRLIIWCTSTRGKSFVYLKVVSSASMPCKNRIQTLQNWLQLQADARISEVWLPNKYEGQSSRSYGQIPFTRLKICSIQCVQCSIFYCIKFYFWEKWDSFCWKFQRKFDHFKLGILGKFGHVNFV
jgi:hypothetical protein